MTQEEVDRAVAVATNESLREIRRIGFSLPDQLTIDWDSERRPLVVDWDSLDATRTVFP